MVKVIKLDNEAYNETPSPALSLPTLASCPIKAITLKSLVIIVKILIAFLTYLFRYGPSDIYVHISK